MDFINVIIFVLFALFAIIVLTPIVLIIYGIIKKKRRLVAVTLIVTFVVVALITAYCVLFPTAFPYCDMWIIGKTRDEIIKVYGEPDGPMFSYYLGEDNGFFGAMDSSDSFYYYISFDSNDKNGIACDVYKGIQLGG